MALLLAILVYSAIGIIGGFVIWQIAFSDSEATVRMKEIDKQVYLLQAEQKYIYAHANWWDKFWFRKYKARGGKFL